MRHANRLGASFMVLLAASAMEAAQPEFYVRFPATVQPPAAAWQPEAMPPGLWPWWHVPNPAWQPDPNQPQVAMPARWVDLGWTRAVRVQPATPLATVDDWVAQWGGTDWEPVWPDQVTHAGGWHSMFTTFYRAGLALPGEASFLGLRGHWASVEKPRGVVKVGPAPSFGVWEEGCSHGTHAEGPMDWGPHAINDQGRPESAPAEGRHPTGEMRAGDDGGAVRVGPLESPSDPLYAEQWALRDVRAETLWRHQEQSFQRRRVLVGVLDVFDFLVFQQAFGRGCEP